MRNCSAASRGVSRSSVLPKAWPARFIRYSLPLYPYRRLKRKAHAQDPVVVEGVKACDRDLLARAHGQAQPAPEMNLTNHQAGRKKDLLLAVVLPVMKQDAV